MPNRQNPPLGFTNDTQRNASNTLLFFYFFFFSNFFSSSVIFPHAVFIVRKFTVISIGLHTF